MTITVQYSSNPRERGSADYYWRHNYEPHSNAKDSEGRNTRRITQLTDAERAEYAAGWAEAEAEGEQKDYG